LIAGCATQQLDRDLKGLLGQPIQSAVDRLGYPDGEREIMGDKIYVWSTNHNAVMLVPTTTTTTGAVGSTPYTGTTTSMHMMPVAYQCVVQLAVNPDGTIKRYQWQGNQGGCAQYARMLNK
jgi:hypothetical protein